MSVTAAPAGDVMRHLRDATREAHAATETVVDPAASLADLDGYAGLLARYASFYVAFEAEAEARIAAVAEREAPFHGVGGFASDRFLKSRWLATDLAALGRDADRPAAGVWPETDGLPGVVGAIYVIEGSMLGGRGMAKEVVAKFGLTRDAGARFFDGYGDATGPLWKDFGDWARLNVTTEAGVAAAVAAAKETFARFGRVVAAPEGA